MQKTLIVLGILAVAAGLAWPWLSRLPFGRLPGDLMVERENFRLYLPFTSMLLLSALVSLIVWLLRR